MGEITAAAPYFIYLKFSSAPKLPGGHFCFAFLIAFLSHAPFAVTLSAFLPLMFSFLFTIDNLSLLR
jgi:hypothetical protein